MKYIKTLVIFGISLILTGCGGEYATMTCEKTEEINGFRIYDKNVTKIEEGLLAYYDEMRTSTALTTSAKGLLPQYATHLEENYGVLNGKAGIIYSAGTVENVHTITIKIEYYNINMSELEDLNDTISPYFKDVNLKKNLEDAKLEYEENGYSCNIKEDEKP